MFPTKSKMLFTTIFKTFVHALIKVQKSVELKVEFVNNMRENCCRCFALAKIKKYNYTQCLSGNGE